MNTKKNVKEIAESLRYILPEQCILLLHWFFDQMSDFFRFSFKSVCIGIRSERLEWPESARNLYGKTLQFSKAVIQKQIYLKDRTS